MSVTPATNRPSSPSEPGLDRQIPDQPRQGFRIIAAADPHRVTACQFDLDAALGDRPAAGVCSFATISIGRKRASSDGAGTKAGSGAKRGSRSHLKIKLALTAYRCATCATETPGAAVWKQIDRFSSSDQSRFVRRAPPIIRSASKDRASRSRRCRRRKAACSRAVSVKLC